MTRREGAVADVRAERWRSSYRDIVGDGSTNQGGSVSSTVSWATFLHGHGLVTALSFGDWMPHLDLDFQGAWDLWLWRNRCGPGACQITDLSTAGKKGVGPPSTFDICNENTNLFRQEKLANAGVDDVKRRSFASDCLDPENLRRWLPLGFTPVPCLISLEHSRVPCIDREYGLCANSPLTHRRRKGRLQRTR